MDVKTLSSKPVHHRAVLPSPQPATAFMHTCFVRSRHPSSSLAGRLTSASAVTLGLALLTQNVIAANIKSDPPAAAASQPKADPAAGQTPYNAAPPDGLPTPDSLPHERKAAAPAGWSAHGQATWIWQHKPGFRAAYTGPNSLIARPEASYSATVGASFGIDLWRGAELHLNPEGAAGVPMSRLQGLGGFANGELARTAGKDLHFYLARALVRQTINLPGLGGHEGGQRGGQGEGQRSSTEDLPAEPLQRPARVSTHRLEITAGTMSVLDIFDDNEHAHDARSQFMNWALLTHGAWDFPADARGYTRGLALAWITPQAALRLGRFAMPRESNGLELDRSLRRHVGDMAELTLAHTLAGRPGRSRWLLFKNQATMGSYREATALAASTGTTPALAATRTMRSKTGWGISLEQQLTEQLGGFIKIAKNNGETETYAFTEIDGSMSAGLTAQGSAWGRPQDTAGFAVAQNRLSAPHRHYLQAGGLGFFLGDGRLNYQPERIIEAYYRWSLPQALGTNTSPGALASWLSLGWQHISNPGYNADRGPVQVYSLRMHLEF